MRNQGIHQRYSTDISVLATAVFKRLLLFIRIDDLLCASARVHAAPIQAQHHGDRRDPKRCHPGSYDEKVASCPEYKIKSAGGSNFTAEVLFYPSEKYLHPSIRPHSLSTYYPKDSFEAARESIALEAIVYMRTVEKKIPKDCSYPEVVRQQKINRGLLRRAEYKEQKLAEYKEQKLAETSSKLRQTTVNSDTYIHNVGDVTDRIRKILSANLPSNRRSPILLDMQAVAKDLSQHTVEATQKLKTTGLFPYGEGSSGDESSGCYDSDMIHLKSEIYDYDSDGRHWDD